MLSNVHRPLVVAGTAIIVVGAGIGVPANAAERTVQVSLTAAEVSSLHTFFDTFGVEPATQDRLVTDLEDGEIWDSMSSQSLPVTTSERSIGGVAWQVSVYQDGSVSAAGVGDAISVGAAGEGIQSLGVNECGYSAGATGNFSNCNIYYWVGAVMSGFRANFTINASGYDKITSVWAPSFTAVGACSVNVPQPNIVKGNESATGAAVAGYTPQATMCATWYTTSFPSYLHVGGNQATHHYS